jgi:hypothetical protein
MNMFTHYITFNCRWFNKFVQNFFQFGDEVYGLLGSHPAKMLHVSGTGLLKHMFGSLDRLNGGTKLKKRYGII